MERLLTKKFKIYLDTSHNFLGLWIFCNGFLNFSVTPPEIAKGDPKIFLPYTESRNRVVCCKHGESVLRTENSDQETEKQRTQFILQIEFTFNIYNKFYILLTSTFSLFLECRFPSPSSKTYIWLWHLALRRVFLRLLYLLLVLNGQVRFFDPVLFALLFARKGIYGSTFPAGSRTRRKLAWSAVISCWE